MSRRLTAELILSTIDRASAPLKKVMGGSRQTATALRAAKDQLSSLQHQQKDVSSLQQLQRATKLSRTELSAASEQARRLRHQIESSANPTKALSRQYERAAAKVSKLRDKHTKHLQTLKTSRRKLSEAGVDIRQLSQHNVALSRDIDTASAAMRRQQTELDRLARKRERLQAASSQFAASQRRARDLTGSEFSAVALGGGITYGAMQAIQPGMEFESSMSQVQALTRLQKDSAEFDALRNQARDLGANTSFSAIDAASGQGFLAMAGFTPDAIKNAMPGMLSMAKAAGIDLGAAADIGSNILTGFDLNASEMGRAGDVLVGTFTRANVDLAMLGETMKYVAPVASGLGGSLEEAAAMAGKLGDAGIQGSMAGTALRAIYSRMAAPPKAAAKALQQLGIQTKDAQGNLRAMPKLLAEINDRTKEMGDAKRSALFKHIAGEEAFSGLAVLVKQAGSGKLQEMVSTLKAAKGEANQIAAIKSDNASGDLQTLKSAAQDVAIELTSLNNGPLRGVIQMITGVTRSVGKWIKANPELSATIAKVVVVGGALLLGLGALALVVSAVLGPLAVMRWMFTLTRIHGSGLAGTLLKLGRVALPIVGKALLWVGRLAMANPIGVAVTAIAGAAYLIYRNWEPIKAFFSGLWQQVKDAFNGGLASIAALLLNWSPIGLIYSAIRKGLGLLGIELPAKFTEFGSNLISGLMSGITNKLTALKETITGAGTGISNWFKDTLGIRSPSRVFISHGGDVMTGLQQGLGDNQQVLKPVDQLSKKLKQAGAGLTLGTVALSAAAAPPLPDLAATKLPDLHAVARYRTEVQPAALPAIDSRQQLKPRIDNRPPLSRQQRTQPAQPAPISVEAIHIHAAPGMDEQAVAQLVMRELERLQAQQAAVNRSNLSDED